jgi:hypothetical protein
MYADLALENGAAEWNLVTPSSTGPSALPSKAFRAR